MAKVLIIDNSPNICSIAACILHEAGHRTATITSGSESVRAVYTEQPDLVLMDYDLEESVTGDKIASWLLGMHPRCRIVLHSSRPESELKQLALACGAIGYIQKCAPQIFLEKVEAFLKSEKRSA